MSELISVEQRELVTDTFMRDKSNFLSYLSAKGRKDTTIRTYNEALKSIYRTMIDLGMDTDIRNLSDVDVVQIKESLNITETSKKLYLIVLGRFQEVITGRNSVKDADILWNHSEHRRLFITPEDFKMMMVSCNEKERLVMMFGAYMGLRRKEICSIRLDDIKGNILRVHGKGHGEEGKVSHLTIPRPVMVAIENYMRIRGDGLCDTLILSDSKERRGLGISYGAVASIVKRVSSRNGVSMTTHSLRRLYATTLYEIGTDLNTIR